MASGGVISRGSFPYLKHFKRLEIVGRPYLVKGKNIRSLFQMLRSSLELVEDRGEAERN